MKKSTTSKFYHGYQIIITQKSGLVNEKIEDHQFSYRKIPENYLKGTKWYYNSSRYPSVEKAVAEAKRLIQNIHCSV